MEVVEAVSDVWGQDRVGVRLSPLGTFNDMGDDDPETTFGHVADLEISIGFPFRSNLTATASSGEFLFADDA
jgi:2,4-dienoyl-CoA reductase-like NADH-dependent reductase (Old Yellow Enzyme family)